MHQTILVTGGAGYIGSHTVVELHQAGFVPVIVDNFSNSDKKVIDRIGDLFGYTPKSFQIDCRDRVALRKVVEEVKPDGFIHFAAFKAVGESVANPLNYYENNLLSLISLLKVMNETNSNNLVFSSSCTVYGQPEKLPVTENSPILKAESPYGNTKQVCEEIIQDTVQSGKPIRALSLRYFNPAGAHPSGKIGELPIGVPNNLVPFITQAAAGLRDQLTVFGKDYPTKDGTCIRDYIHVVDLAKAHVKAIELLFTKLGPFYYDVFNIGTGKGESVMGVIQAFEKVSGLKLNYKIGSRRPGDITEIYANVEKSASHLNWKAELTIEDAMRDAWNWQKGLIKE